MRTLARLFVAICACLLLAGGMCRKTAGTNFMVTNNSAVIVRNVEVAYPGGTFGAPSIEPGKSVQKWVPATGVCHLKVRFNDAANKEQSHDVDLGQQCPPASILEITADMDVTARSPNQ